MSRALFLLVGFILALGSCTQRMICPAYQSAFIHDQPSLSRRVSYFKEDSTPKILTVSKNKYLIIPDQSYRKKIRSMQTVEMKPVYTVLPDSLQEKKEDEFAGAESDSTTTLPDSLKKKETKDSIYQISKDREVRVLKYSMDSAKYHIENIMYTSDQDNYMWYFRDVLVLPDVRAALAEEQNVKEGKTPSGKVIKKEKKGGFFKNLFKNPFKKKPKNDSTAVTSPAVPADSVSGNAPTEKKGGFFKRKKKKVDATPVKKIDPAKKEDDGF